MPHSDLDIISKHVFDKLSKLSPDLTYHSIGHTKDVVRQSERIAREEGVKEDDIYNLKVAALYHDTGFLETYIGHEQKSCEIFLSDANRFLFTESQKQIICKLIMATKVPQKPKTILQNIICDADLDYLGRDDFPEISALLKKEFLAYKIVADEQDWMEKQLLFLKNHQYHTLSSRNDREEKKQFNLLRLH